MNKSHINRDAYGRDNSNRGRVRFGLIAVILALSGIALLTVWREGRSQENSAAEGTSELSDELSNEMQFEYGEYLKRALPYGIPSMARTHALQQMKAMAEANLQPRGGTGKSAPEGGPSAIQWSPLGPQPILHGQGLSAVGFCGTAPRLHASGRATEIAFGALPSTVYLGTANGGVWKSIDGGAFWTVLTDKEPSLAVGALAVVPNANTARDVIYAGTGEGNQGCDSEFGQGILKSTDGGHSWTQLGEPTPFDRMTFTRIAVAPKAGAAGQDVLYAGTRTGFTNSAAFICLGAMSINPGLFKSTDGGVTWIQMSGSGGLPAAGGDPGAATDLVLDPANSNTVYVAIAGTKSNSGGLWKSTDGGASWTQFTAAKNHFPQAAARINLDISADGSSLWAARTADGSTFDNVYLSTNRGATWTAGGGALPKIGATGCLKENQEFYDMVVRGDPSGFANTVLLGLTGIYRSTDRGTKWTFIGTGIHGDFHDLAIIPEGIFAANDGGLFLSPNDGIAWDSSPNDQLSITQFQSVALPPSGTGMIGGTQDNGTNVFTAGLGWEHGDDGDGGYTAIDPSSPNIVFAEHFNTTSALSLDRSSSRGIARKFHQYRSTLG